MAGLTRRQLIGMMGVGMTAAVTSAVGGYWYASRIEPERLSVEHVRLTLPRLPRAFAGYRIAHISDIHTDHRHMTLERLRGIVTIVNSHAPDFVAITGDFVTRGDPQRYRETLIQGLRALNAVDGVAGVLGNHDHWSHAGGVRDILQAAGVHELRNDVLTVRRGDDSLHITGVDDVWENYARLDRVLDRLPSDGAAVLLAHKPDFADESAATGRFDLQLSGHSHGGQCVAPGGYMPYLPELGKKYPSGLYRVGEMWQYTNRGLGMTWAPQVRFNCPPEITILTLQ